ncbi:MAG: aminoacetone oxidase family FAD-binding enzyme, partial [Clostridia bacterium]|nr:aminoacetone oxidase family FAD-binding enzyme [Clostridia bacterium]
KRVEALLLDGDRVTGVKLEDGAQIAADAVIVATGGLSYPATGSTGDGYRLAKQAGHKVTPTSPSLIPLEIADACCPALDGLSLRNVTLTVREKGTAIFEEFGEMLFTSFGISGPLTLSASAHITEPKNCTLSIDLKPALSFEQLDARLLRDFHDNGGKVLSNALSGLLPQRLIPVILAAAGLDPTLRVAQLTKEMRTHLLQTLKGWTLSLSGFRPIEEAVVTRGGVDVKEIEPKTMASRLCRGLFFAGEVMDLDAYTGGYNLQIAFSTGMAAGRGVSSAMEKEVHAHGRDHCR